MCVVDLLRHVLILYIQQKDTTILKLWFFNLEASQAFNVYYSVLKLKNYQVH